ncbi:glycoside hydrolase family 20 zincin-like fold domain-containing protein [[Ruminococcus] torques]|nr:glycoside hydrolase family 20 zincin-like fold domain-containing protein [[Ruminococcus] torques]
MTVDEKTAVEAETTTGAFWATRTILQSLKANGNIPQGVAETTRFIKCADSFWMSDVRRLQWTGWKIR